MLESRPNLKKGRKCRVYSTQLEIPVQSGQPPWPAPYVAALVLESMLKKKDKKRTDLISRIVICLGGSPDQLARYRKRLSEIQVSQPPFHEKEEPRIPIIQWLTEVFEYYPNSRTEESQMPYFYDNAFFAALPEKAIVGLFKGRAQKGSR